MRILIINAHGDDHMAGGVERGLRRLSEELLRRGFQVSSIQAFPGGSPVPGTERTILHSKDWRESEVRRLRNHTEDVLAMPSRRLQRLVAQYHPDLVNTHNLPGITTGIWEICRRLDIPVVHTLHDYHLLCPRVTLMRKDGRACRPSPLLCGLRTRMLARWSGVVSHVIGVSQYLVDLHQPLFPDATFHVIRNPLTCTGQREPPAGARPRTIGYIGSLEAIKGVEELLRAAAVLARYGITVSLAGEGRLRARVEAMSKECAYVDYHGVVSGDAKAAFLASCDLGIVPSLWAEPGGPNQAMLDWICAARPVLFSGRGGLGELADRYPATFMIEPTQEGIVTAVRGLLAPETWRDAVANAELRLSNGKAEFEHWVDAHERVIRAAAAERGLRERCARLAVSK
jgi:glycosyltransferase involved in cell wall biosynthesis